VSHSERRNRAMTGSNSSCAAVRARFMRFSVIFTVGKMGVHHAEAPMYRLSSRRAVSPSPMTSSVLPRRCPPPAGARLRSAWCGHPVIDEPRLLHARDDLDRVAQRLARTVEKRALALRLAQGVGADHAHAPAFTSRSRWPKRSRHWSARVVDSRLRRPCSSIPAARRTGSRRRSTMVIWPCE